MFIRQEVYLQSAHAADLSPFIDARTQQRDVVTADGVWNCAGFDSSLS